MLWVYLSRLIVLHFWLYLQSAGSCIKIVPRANAIVVGTSGGYLTTWSVGLHLQSTIYRLRAYLKGFVKRARWLISHHSRLLQKIYCNHYADPIPLYTSRLQIQSFMHNGVENPIMAIENLTAQHFVTLSSVISIDETLTYPERRSTSR